MNNITKKHKNPINRLIIAGDFNRCLDYVELTFGTKTLRANNIMTKNYRNDKITCCYNKINTDKYGFVDNILDSAHTDINKNNESFDMVCTKEISDHCLIKATL